LILLDSKFVALGKTKQQTFRHKIKMFRKNGKSCDIVSEETPGIVKKQRAVFQRKNVCQNKTLNLLSQLLLLENYTRLLRRLV
jgi:GTPase Era involved in 16S rRNA processing